MSAGGLLIKSFLQGVLDDDSHAIFDNLVWFTLRVVSVVPSALIPLGPLRVGSTRTERRHRHRLGQNLVELLVRGHTSMVLTDALDMGQDLFPRDIQLVIDKHASQ